MTNEQLKQLISQPHRMVDGQPVLLTQNEINERVIEESEWLAGATQREVIKIEQLSGMDRGEREIAIKLLPETSARRARAEQAERAITALGIRKGK